MPGIFVDPNDEIVINVCYGFDKNNLLYADMHKEGLLATFESILVKDSIKEVELVFKRPSYGDLIDAATGMLSEAEIRAKLDPEIAKLNRMIRLVKRWDLVDSEGKPVTANEINIRNLHPTIATVINIQLDREIGG